MNKPVITLISLFLIASSAWAPGVITTFSATNTEDYILLEWTSGLENGVTEYHVERSLDGLDFQTISIVYPEGSNSDYSYQDSDLYKATSRAYFYRISALMSNGTSNFSAVQSVTLSFSGIQQTWGSIKSLFR